VVGESAEKQRSSLKKNVMSGSKEQFYNTQNLKNQGADDKNRERWGRNSNNMMVDSSVVEISNSF